MLQAWGSPVPEQIDVYQYACVRETLKQELRLRHAKHGCACVCALAKIGDYKRAALLIPEVEMFQLLCARHDGLVHMFNALREAGMELHLRMMVKPNNKDMWGRSHWICDGAVNTFSETLSCDAMVYMLRESELRMLSRVALLIVDPQLFEHFMAGNVPRADYGRIFGEDSWGEFVIVRRNNYRPTMRQLLFLTDMFVTVRVFNIARDLAGYGTPCWNYNFQPRVLFPSKWDMFWNSDMSLRREFAMFEDQSYDLLAVGLAHRWHKKFPARVPFYVFNAILRMGAPRFAGRYSCGLTMMQ